MALNATRISWAQATLNLLPFCGRGCAYCYRRRIVANLDCPDCKANRPHFHQDRLEDLTRPHPKAPLRVFLNSLGETFDPSVRPEWHKQLWPAVEASPHQVVIATKRPELIGRATFPWAGRNQDWPANLWLLVSAENQQRLDLRLTELLRNVQPGRLGLSLEPALGPFHHLDRWLPFVEWVVFGGLSGRWLPTGWTAGSLTKAQTVWATEAADQVDHHNRETGRRVALFVKQDTPLPGAPESREFPLAMSRPSPAPARQLAMF